MEMNSILLENLELTIKKFKEELTHNQLKEAKILINVYSGILESMESKYKPFINTLETHKDLFEGFLDVSAKKVHEFLINSEYKQGYELVNIINDIQGLILSIRSRISLQNRLKNLPQSQMDKSNN